MREHGRRFLREEKSDEFEVGKQTFFDGCGARSRAAIFKGSVKECRRMREKSNENGHDPRFIDLAAVFALLVVVAAAYTVICLDRPAPKLSSRIIPSQNTRW